MVFLVGGGPGQPVIIPGSGIIQWIIYPGYTPDVGYPAVGGPNIHLPDDDKILLVMGQSCAPW
jgi:hypothetical protein